ncbi:MAG: SRPBCC family protein [Bacteroidota bacterium]
MKVLKGILIVLVILIAIPLIAAIFVSKDLNYEQSVEIEAPIDHVWEQVNSLQDMDKWSPWNEYDPNMEKEWSGAEGSVGSTQSWVSDHENVGVGSQTIAKVEAPNLMETDLKFMTPFESVAKAHVKLDEMAEGTKVTWGFESEMPYPFNLMKVFVDFDAAMDKDFGIGLGKLKAIAESTLPTPEPAVEELEVEGEAEASDSE